MKSYAVDITVLQQTKNEALSYSPLHVERGQGVREGHERLPVGR